MQCLRSDCVHSVASPDIVAQEQAVCILGLEGLLAFDGPKPPGVIDDRPEAIACRHTAIDGLVKVSGGLKECKFTLFGRFCKTAGQT